MAFFSRKTQPGPAAPDLKKQQIELEIQQAEFGIVEFFRTMPRWMKIASIVALILIIPMFFASKYATSYFYLKKLNKNEILVHVSQVVTLPVKVETVQALKITGTSYAAYAEIKNQNSELSSPNVTYTFNFLDANGNQISSANGSTSLLPGEDKFIVDPRTNLPAAPASVTISVNPNTWQQRTNAPTVTLTETTPTFADDGMGGFVIQGAVQNQSVYTIGTVVVNGFAYDSKGNVLAVTQTVYNTQAPGENRGYRLYWPDPEALQTASVKVFTDTNILDPSNIH